MVNYPGLKTLLEMGLNAEEISVIFGVHSRTIKREAKKLGIILKVGHPPKGHRLSREDKVAIYTLADRFDTTLASIVRTTGLNARSVYRFLEEIDNNDWGRNICLQCNKSFITEKQKENKLCPECKKGTNSTNNWLENSAECQISLPE